MKRKKREQLRAHGWIETTVEEFLGLTAAELAYIDLKIALSDEIRKKRKNMNLTQMDFAEQIGSSQSRVAKMEASDPTVSLDLLIRSLLALDNRLNSLADVIVDTATDKEPGKVLVGHASAMVKMGDMLIYQFDVPPKGAPSQTLVRSVGGKELLWKTQ
jgi:transcriptional regulator with XRE-family HTH domain